MIPNIKAEFRKLFTVRSTYILGGLSLVFLCFYDFYIVGFKGGIHGGPMATLVGPSSPTFLMSQVARAGGVSGPILLSTIVAILLMAHEYRYNTILYTLTSSNSRNKTLLAKIIAVTCFTVIFSLGLEILGPALALLGLHAHHIKLGHQIFYYRDYIWRIAFYGWAYGMIGLLLAVLFRNVIVSIVSIFLIPIAVEPLLDLLLNTSQQQYLPFTALTAVVNSGIIRSGPGILSAVSSALVVLVYIVIGWVVAWVLFLRRDAN
jgi:ABC-type transport system involved in multi-copper enzyme maturation permease subunit